MTVSMLPEKVILPVRVMLADSSDRRPEMLLLINAIQQHLFLEKVAVLAVLSITIVPIWVKIIRSDISSYTVRKGNSALTREVVDTINKYTNEDDQIQAFGHLPVYYNVSNRRAATRFMFFTTQVDSFKNNHEEFFNTLEAKKPKIIITLPIDYYNESLKDFLDTNDYRLVYPMDENGKPVEPGRDDVDTVYVFYRSSDEDRE